ncbi:MAG: threonyl-tRNA synthetase [Candidatus Marinimicrobia bacterium]|nr:threonyl-tRNA synthetase [Candidatus Neomarinimicrobiota bacterium]
MTDTIKITLPDGSVQEFPIGSTPYDVALSISEGLARNCLAAKVNGKLIDLKRPLLNDSEIFLITYKSPEAHEILLHSTAHIMAQAVQRLFKDVKVTIGPAIENRFYYDFDAPVPFTEEDLDKIEKEMEKIISEDLPITRREVTRDEAIRFFKNLGETYKVEIIRDIPEDEILSIYTQGEFSDLCRGPHIPSTGKVPAFKLLSVAGAYWRGDERNKMLSRIYGTAFPDKKGLKNYLNFLEEAKKRDHRKLGRELDLFDFSDRVGQGLPLWFPKGATLRKIIEDFWHIEHRKAGYELVQTPHIGKSELWETSGHLGFYKDSMYSPMEVEGQDYYIKPMNCPFHIMIFNRRQHSYRDLPVRYAELGTVYRYEMSGVLHGLMRVRGFTQDDAHIICTPDQLNDEVEKLIQFSFDYLKTFGFTEFEVYLSTRPEGKSVGDPADWEQAQASLRASLKKKGVDFEVDEGGGAFYGPKIDIKIKDAIGRLWQCTTIQFDFNEPERFDMEYTGADGNKHQPFMIHRAIMGSLERFIGILLEDTAGHFPMWLAPVQVKLLPIADRHLEYAREIADSLFQKGIRVEMDDRQEKIGAKIRDAELNKIPFMCIIGDKEVDDRLVSVRQHRKGDQGSLRFDEFIHWMQEASRPEYTE